jgi:hypothetical protein
VGIPAAGITSGEVAENTLSFSVGFPATLVHIGSASISGLVVPVTGEPPVLAGTLSSGDSSKYTVQSLIWSPTVSGTFAGGVSYTAAIELKAAPGYKFTGSITPSTGGVGTPAAGTPSGDAAENTLSFNVSFPPTANTGISIGDPSVKLYLNEGTMALEQNGSTPMGSAGVGIYTVKIAPDTYTGIKWYLNGVIVAQGATKTAITLSMQDAGTFKVTVEAEPQGGSKNTGTHTFIITN